MNGRHCPKVVHLIVAGQIGGAEHGTRNLITRPALSGADHVVALMTPNQRLRDFFIEAGVVVRDRGPVRENPAAYVWRAFGPTEVAWLTRVLREERADIIHAHTYGSQVLAVRAGLRVNLPVLRTEHGVGNYRDPTCAPFRQWALRNSDLIATVGEFVARVVAEVAPAVRPKLRVVPNGIDIARFKPQPKKSDGPFTFCMATRLEPVKRVDIAIDALASVPDVRLDIAGEGSLRTRLEAQARRRGVADRVRFLGFLKDPRSVVAECDATINCTVEEGLPQAVLEASAMERPTIGYDGGGIPEIVHDNETGWLVREHSVAAFASAMAKASADPKKALELGLNAKSLVERKHTIDSNCRGYAAVYAELARMRAVPVAA